MVDKPQPIIIECKLVDEVLFGYAWLSKRHQTEVLQVLASAFRVCQEWIEGFEAWSDGLKKKVCSFF